MEIPSSLRIKIKCVPVNKHIKTAKWCYISQETKQIRAGTSFSWVILESWQTPVTSIICKSRGSQGNSKAFQALGLYQATYQQKSMITMEHGIISDVTCSKSIGHFRKNRKEENIIKIKRDEKKKRNKTRKYSVLNQLQVAQDSLYTV